MLLALLACAAAQGAETPPPPTPEWDPTPPGPPLAPTPRRINAQVQGADPLLAQTVQSIVDAVTVERLDLLAELEAGRPDAFREEVFLRYYRSRGMTEKGAREWAAQEAKAVAVNMEKMRKAAERNARKGKFRAKQMGVQ